MAEKEINLRDYIKIILKHKWIVILVPVISVITTAIFTLGFTPKPVPRIYEGVVTIQNGFLGGPVIEKQEAMERVKILGSELSGGLQIEDIPNTLYFKIRLKGNTPEEIKETCEKMAEECIETGNSLYDTKYKIYKDKLDILNQRKQLLEEEISEIQVEFSDLSKIPRITQIEIFNKSMDYRSRILNYRLTVMDIRSNISDISLSLTNAREFKIIGTIQITPVSKPNKKARLLISAVMGLVGGVLLAFAIENWSLPIKGDQ